jgi:hypothetical protein
MPRRKLEEKFELFKIKNSETFSIDEKETGIIYAKQSEREPIQFSENSENYFAYNSLWIFSSENKFRILIQKIVSSKPFIEIINTLIIINCIFLIFETIPSLAITSIYSEFIFTIIFIIEFVLKVIAYGFILETHSYLKDPWNWLDFIVVISSIINLFPQVNTKLFALRTIRLIRPLKTMSLLPHMRTFILVLINSLLDVGTVFILICFFVIIFAIFGLSFWNEKFDYRCRTTNYPINGILKIERTNFYHLCGGEVKCENCLSVKRFYRENRYFLSEIYNYKNQINFEEFNYGLTTFNNFGWSLLTVFQILTGNGWNNIMFLLMDGHNYYISLIYFVLCICVNYYFTSNLTVAVLIYNFRKARLNELTLYYDEPNRIGIKKIKKLSLMMNINLDNYNEKKVKQNYQLKYSPIELTTNFVENFHNLNEHEDDEHNDKKKNIENFEISFWRKLWRKIHCITKIKEHKQYHKNHKFAFYCYIIYKQPIFQIFIFICIIGNGIIIALDRVNISQKEKDINEILNMVLVCIFVIEMFISIVGNGREFFYDKINVFDAIIVLISLTEIILNHRGILGDYENNSTSIASTFQLLRIFRIFKLLRSLESFQIIMESILETIMRIIDFLILFVIFIFMYTLLGFQFFRESLRFQRRNYNPKEESNFYNFDNFPNSLICVFMIIIGDHWYDIFYDCYRSKKNNRIVVIVYFVTLTLFGNITLLNVFLAYLIDNFQSSLHHLQKNRNVHLFILELIYKSSEISSSKIINYTEMINNKKGQKYFEKLVKNTNTRNNSKKGSVYNYFLMKLYSKNLEFEGDIEIVARNKIDFILFKASPSEYFKKKQNEPKVFLKDQTFVIKRTFTLNKIIDNDPKKEERARNEAIKYIDTIDSYYSFELDYEMQNDAKTNLKNERKYNYEKYNKQDITNPQNLILESHSKNDDSESQLIQNFTIKEYNDSEIRSINNTENSKNEINKNEKKESFNFNKTNKNEVSKKNNEMNKSDNSFNKVNIQVSRTLKRPRVNYNEINDNLDENNSIYIDRNYTNELPQATNLISQRTKMLMETEILDTDTSNVSEEESIIMDYSLFLFSPDNKFRQLCYNILDHWLFNYILVLLIIGNVIIISLDHPCINPSSKRKKVIDVLNYFFNIIFIIEAIIKIVNQGLLLNKNAYLRSIINIIDFCCIIIGLIDMGLTDKNIRYIRSVRMIRIVKPIRIITNSENLYLMSKTLVSSIYALSNLLIACLIFMFILSMIGVSIFKDSLYYYCLENPKYNEEQCIKYNGKWIYNDNNFSNFFKSLKVMFELMVAEDWSNLMRLGSLTKSNKNYEFFFVIIILLLHMLFLNLIIAIVIQNYDNIKQQRNYIKELTEPEREWVHIQKIFMKYHPLPKIRIPKEKSFKRLLIIIVTSKSFEVIISILILLSCLTLLFQHNGSTETFDNTLTYINLGFTFLFTIEIIIKLIVYKKSFFLNNWNIFDFIIITSSIILAILNILTLTDIINVKSLSSLPIILRLFRLFRILRIFNQFGKLKSLIDTLVYLIPSLSGIGLFIIILLTIYGNIGMHAFSKSPFRKYITKINNFRSFLSSISILFQCITGEDWVNYMNELSFHDCRDPNSKKYQSDYFCFYFDIKCYDDKNVNYTSMMENNFFSCGNNFAYIYFISFMIIGPIFIMNLCVVMVIEGFTESIYENEGYLPRDLMDKFINLWINYDPLCTKIIKPYEFILMMKELPPPIGLNYDRHLIQGINDDIKESKRERDYKQFLQCRELIRKNKDKLFLDKPNFCLPQIYICNNFYLSKDGNFFTNDIEVMKLISKFQIISSDEKLKHYLNNDSEKLNEEIKRNSYIFSSEKLNDKSITNVNNEKEKYLVIHFIDACMTITQFAISKSMNVHFDVLRRNVVSSYTKKLWKTEYKNEDIEPFFVKNKSSNIEENSNFLSMLLACQVLLKFKKKIKERIRRAREKIKLKKNPKNIFGKFSEMRQFKNENMKIKRVNSDLNDKNTKIDFINNMSKIYMSITQSNRENGIYDTNIYATGIKKKLISETDFSGIFYNNNELNDIINSKRNNSFSHSCI